MRTAISVCLIATIATVADAVWYTFGVRHTLVAGVVHGAIVLTAVGGAIGHAAGRLVQGLPIGAMAGVAGAASYYALTAVVDRRTYGSAIPIAWVLTWFYLAAFEGRWLQAPDRRAWRQIAVRGLVAAVASGAAFYLVMRVLWGAPPPGGRSYLVQFLAWAFAWAPGVAALTAGPRHVSPRASSARLDRTVGADAPSEGAAASDVEDLGTSVTATELLSLIDSGEVVHILDVRSEGEFAAGHVPGAVNVPFTQVSARIDEVPGAAHDTVIVYCGHGPRAYIAASALRRAGRPRITYMSGHWAGWQALGLRVER